MVAVSLDRYHVLLHPFKPKLSTKSAFIIIILIWLIALGSSIPSVLFYKVYFIDNFVYQCLPYTDEQQQPNNATVKPYDIHKIYIVYNIYSQYIIPFVIISCAYFRIGSHLYFSKPVGQTTYQEVMARNKRKVRLITLTLKMKHKIINSRSRKEKIQLYDFIVRKRRNNHTLRQSLLDCIIDIENEYLISIENLGIKNVLKTHSNND